MREKTVIMKMDDIIKIFKHIFREQANLEGVNITYRAILFHLDRENGLSQKELVNRIHYKAPSISITLKNMEKEELIIKKTDENDGRLYKIFITEKGKEINNKFFTMASEVDREIVSSITDDERKCLDYVLGKLYQKALEMGGCLND